MSEYHLLLLLQIIQTSEDVGLLLKKGLQYYQIVDLIIKGQGQGYIIQQDNTLKLSEKGLAKLKNASKFGKLMKDGHWIRPLEEFRIEKLSPNDLYLPPNDVLTQLRREH